MCRIVYNVADKNILLFFVSNSKSQCSHLTVCNHEICLGSNKNKIKSVVFKETTKFCLCIIEIFCNYIHPDLYTMFIWNMKKAEIILTLNIDRNEFFCCCLRDSISKIFWIEAEDFVSKKKKNSSHCFWSNTHRVQFLLWTD